MSEEGRIEARAEDGERRVDVPPSGPADELAVAAGAEAAAFEEELGVVLAALDRLEEGSYGRCEICGTALDDTLLEADPTVGRCPAHRAV